MFQKTGFKGWVLLFDEGEFIAQLRINVRRKSYTILNQFFSSASPLPALSSKEWETMSEKLIHFHAKAYGWKPLETEMQEEMAKILAEKGDREARLKIKAMVNHLDLAHQKVVLGG